MRKQFLFLLLFIPSFVQAQSTNVSTLFYGSVKKADIFFNHFAYKNALLLYEHAQEKNPEDVYLMEQIAECHFKLHQPFLAEHWFRKVVEKPSYSKRIRFDFAESLCMNGNYSEAQYWYEQALEQDPENQMIKDKITFIKNIAYYEVDSLEFMVSPVEFNTIHAEYGAHRFRDGLVFSSSRDLSWIIKHRPFDAVDEGESLLNLFYVSGKKIGEFGETELLHQERTKAILHEGPIAFYDNDQKAVFTRTNMRALGIQYDENNKAHLQIFFADINSDRELKNIRPFPYNNDNHSIGHPTITPDGKTLYFTSTAPGGQGGADIYYSNNIDGNWSVPVNLGRNINTPGEESFPFIANDSTLYFSSNGHGSLGGLDILVSKVRNGMFTKPENFGSPLNTRFDDFSFVADPQIRSGFLASNRPGGRGVDDIYYFEVSDYFLKGHTVVDNKRTGGVNIKVIDAATGQVVSKVTSDSTGFYDIKLPFDKKYYIETEKEGVQSTGRVDITTVKRGLNVDSLTLKAAPFRVHSKGKIFSKETQQVIKGVTLIATNLTDNKQEKIQIDGEEGYDYTLLSEKTYRLEFSKPGYLTQVVDINTAGLKDYELKNDVLLEEEFEKSMVINYQYKKDNLTVDATKALKPLVDLLKKYSGHVVNIAAHADSRGTKELNQELSDRRAKRVRDYLVSQGISESRINWVGFGETLVLNRCVDGVKCSEADHSLNRRAEIKIQRK